MHCYVTLKEHTFRADVKFELKMHTSAQCTHTHKHTISNHLL